MNTVIDLFDRITMRWSQDSIFNSTGDPDTTDPKSRLRIHVGQDIQGFSPAIYLKTLTRPDTNKNSNT
jgi:hypothetical protein